MGWIICPARGVNGQITMDGKKRSGAAGVVLLGRNTPAPRRGFCACGAAGGRVQQVLIMQRGAGEEAAK